MARSVYSLRDEISYCRSPFTAAQEFPEGYKGGAGNHSFKEEGQAWAHVYTKRWEPVGKTVQAFDTAVLEAEALWGKDIKEKAVELRSCISSLQVYIEAFIRNKFNGGESFKDREFAKEVEYGVWDIKADENKPTQRINNAIEGIESFIRPHLSRS